jgi:hypothetical protein
MSLLNTTLTVIRAGQQNNLIVDFITKYANNKEADVTYEVTLNGITKTRVAKLRPDDQKVEVNYWGLVGTLQIHPNSAISFKGSLMWEGQMGMEVQQGVIIAINS